MHIGAHNVIVRLQYSGKPVYEYHQFPPFKNTSGRLRFPYKTSGTGYRNSLPVSRAWVYVLHNFKNNLTRLTHYIIPYYSMLIMWNDYKTSVYLRFLDF